MDNTDRMLETAERLAELRQNKAHLEEMIRIVGQDIELTEQRLSDMMMENDTQNFTHGGMTYCLTTRTYASPVKGQKDALFQALRDNGSGDLVTEQVNANSLASFVKEQMEEHGNALPDWLDGLVHVFEQTTVGMRKASRR